MKALDRYETPWTFCSESQYWIQQLRQQKTTWEEFRTLCLATRKQIQWLYQAAADAHEREEIRCVLGYRLKLFQRVQAALHRPTFDELYEEHAHAL